jgi:predicted RNase H-like HicB family nuclease
MDSLIAKYPVLIRWSEKDNAYIAEMPDLPRCMADGTTREEALTNLEESARLWMEVAQEEGWTIPEPGSKSKQAAA